MTLYTRSLQRSDVKSKVPRYLSNKFPKVIRINNNNNNNNNNPKIY